MEKVEHVKQNNPKCIQVMQSIGCFVRSCGLVAEYKTGKSLNVSDINDLWRQSKLTGLVDDKDNVIASAPIINKALAMLGHFNGHFEEVGTFRNNIFYWYPSVPIEKRHADAIIQKVETERLNTHFRLVDASGQLIEDPFTPVCKVKKVYYSIAYKYVEEVKKE